MKAYVATKGITVVEATVSNVNDIQQADNKSCKSRCTSYLYTNR